MCFLPAFFFLPFYVLFFPLEKMHFAEDARKCDLHPQSGTVCSIFFSSKKGARFCRKKWKNSRAIWNSKRVLFKVKVFKIRLLFWIFEIFYLENCMSKKEKWREKNFLSIFEQRLKNSLSIILPYEEAL